MFIAAAAGVVPIVAADDFEGVRAEYRHLESRFGFLGVDWDIEERTLWVDGLGRCIESFMVSRRCVLTLTEN